MGTLSQTLRQDMISAMKSKDASTLSVIRYLLAQIKNVEIDHGEQSDEQEMAILSKEVKKINEAIEQLTIAGRNELVAEEKAKIKVIQQYLPKQLSEDELKTLILSAIEEVKDKSHGEKMRVAMAAVKGRADGKEVARILQQM